jgi:hypothetical protein
MVVDLRNPNRQNLESIIHKMLHHSYQLARTLIKNQVVILKF